MLPTINVTDNLEQLTRWARFVAADQVPFATALALTRTAQDTKAEAERQIGSNFDRATPFTRRALRLRRATPKSLRAVVEWKFDARDWLAPQVHGGNRRPKALEKALIAAGHLPAGWMVVPGQGARLDQFGNMERGQVIQVLSQLRITMTAGYTRNMSWSASKSIAAQRKAGGRFFVFPPGVDGVKPGVYQREFMGRTITPVLIFVRGANYRVRLPLERIADAVASARFAGHFMAAFRLALATARSKS